MENFSNLDLFTLVDMLAKHTNEYMRMQKEGASDEDYAKCKKIIQAITAEIEYRKEKNVKPKRSGASKNS
jgi:hypothetical protein